MDFLLDRNERGKSSSNHRVSSFSRSHPGCGEQTSPKSKQKGIWITGGSSSSPRNPPEFGINSSILVPEFANVSSCDEEGIQGGCGEGEDVGGEQDWEEQKGKWGKSVQLWRWVDFSFSLSLMFYGSSRFIDCFFCQILPAYKGKTFTFGKNNSVMKLMEENDG